MLPWGDGAELLSGFSKSKGPIWGHHQNPIDSSPFQGNLKISQKYSRLRCGTVWMI